MSSSQRPNRTVRLVAWRTRSFCPKHTTLSSDTGHEFTETQTSMMRTHLHYHRRYRSNLTTCSLVPRSIFSNRFATQPYRGFVTALPPSRPAPVLAPTLAAFSVRACLSSARGRACEGAPRSARSICAVSTCCSVGPALCPAGADREEKLDAEGEDGVGVCVDSSRRYALEKEMNTGHVDRGCEGTYIVSFARGGLLLFVLLPRASKGWPGMMISPTVAQIFSCSESFSFPAFASSIEESDVLRSAPALLSL